jgi:hypothetical protein
MDVLPIREFLWETLRTLVLVSPISVWNALRKVQPRPRPEWAKRIPQPVASVILFVLIAMMIYWAWPSPNMLGIMVGLFLTIPLERLVMLVNKRIINQAHTSKP